MPGAVRETLARLRERIALLASGEGSDRLSEDLLAVVALLGREHRLRNALADPGSEPERRAALARTVLAGHVGRMALSFVEEAVQARWASPRELVDEIEVLGAKAAFAQAEDSAAIDTVEEDLFRFGRIVVADPRLRRILDDTNLPAEAKQAIVRDLVEAKAHPTSLALLLHLVAVPRGRHIDDAIEDFIALAAERRHEILAQVTVAAPLTAEQEQRLEAVLGRLYNRTVKMHVDVDPDVVGGVRVIVGDEVVDGTMVHRLAEARRRMVG